MFLKHDEVCTLGGLDTAKIVLASATFALLIFLLRFAPSLESLLSKLTFQTSIKSRSCLILSTSRLFISQ